MDQIKAKTLKGKRGMAHQLASRSTDPHFYAALEFLPNPDPILRRMGRTQDVYDSLVGDAHILGDLRSVRSALLGFEHRIKLPDEMSEDAASIRALELCQMMMNFKPSHHMQWSDVIWSIAQAVFRGFSVHEVTWSRHDSFLMPSSVIDVPQKRFVFGNENEPRLLTKENRVNGIAVDDHKFLVSRHMASFDNPYGVAVFSACVWPQIFKHSGFKYFAKFCEKYGIPKAVGNVPIGTDTKVMDEFADQLAQMIEDGVAVLPGDGTVSLLETSHSGSPMQQQLIDLCNKELSKAITSQTLATEIQGQGSRAAAETHRERETTVNQSDRKIIEDVFNQLFQWVTDINIPGATAPVFEFYEEAQAQTEMVEFIDKALDFVPLKTDEVYDRLQMTKPDGVEDVIPVKQVQHNTPNLTDENTDEETHFQGHNCPNCGGHNFNKDDDQEEEDKDTISPIIDQSIELGDDGLNHLIEPIDDLIDRAVKEGLTVEEFQASITELYPAMDSSKMGQEMQQSFLTAYLLGMDEVGE